ncbi:hypothetical protein Fmac_006793 [Flemingia macrophylla]|uniref:Uncharacterized protein n=1 Tax=Flemingia macrophylla TaxID=520843 RepID=A0ABD1NBM4_9FABA
MQDSVEDKLLQKVWFCLLFYIIFFFHFNNATFWIEHNLYILLSCIEHNCIDGLKD